MLRAAPFIAPLVVVVAGGGGCAAQAQVPSPAPIAPPAQGASAPAPERAVPASGDGADTPQRVEVTGGRETDEDQRRQATAAKIVISRDEILRHGDASLADVMKRLPGVTTSGPPGRGGLPALRGLGGYTQILIDGQAAPAGFTIDQLTPEQLERIEIYRAPTAETGARAIAGTINLVMREASRRRMDEWRVGAAVEGGEFTPSLHGTLNRAGPFSVNVTAGLYAPRGRQVNVYTTLDDVPGSGEAVHREATRIDSTYRRIGGNLGARLQWRGDEGDMLTLSPGFFGSTGDFGSRFRITESAGPPAPGYEHGVTDGRSGFGSLRLGAELRRRAAADWRLELNGLAADARWSGHTLRREFDPADALTRTESVDSRGRERTLSASGKAIRMIGVDGSHRLVLGGELEQLRRDERRVTLNDGVHQYGEDDDDLEASVLRTALYAQDEWALGPGWSAQLGLRGETITTRGDAYGGGNPRHRSQVTTPLMHLLYKPDPKQRDQIRLSLTRSYKAPSLQNLIGRPGVSSRFPIPGANTPTYSDRAGNPGLRPELATGIDLAFERYLGSGGLLSVNLTTRRITDSVRYVTRLETVDYADVPRWVSRPVNVGRARMHGIELEAKFRLDGVIAAAPPVELRLNGSAYRSRVAQVPGPDNRLDAQPDRIANLGADYRLRSLPLSIGGSLNLTPGYRTQQSDTQATTTPRKRQIDAYALWVFDPALQLRLNLANLFPEDYTTATVIDGGALRETQVNAQRSFLGVRLTLELKL